jgi:hypothetical protein
MSDIVERIDALLANTPPAEIEEFEVCRCLRDAKAEIESLRLAIRRLAEQDATLSVHGGNVTVTLDATLTVEERGAIEKAIGRELDTEWYGGKEPDRVVALRGLLERTK